jgi:localization factor PodJL
MALLQSGDRDAGLAAIRAAAQGGLPDAQFRLARLMETGDIPGAGPDDARDWYERAARAGHREAMFNLGNLYAQGTGVPVDLTRAYSWFEQAARLGMTNAQYNLGILLESGAGVPENPAQAYFWYSVAAGRGDTEARARQNVLADRLEPARRAELAQAAADWRPQAAAAGTDGPSRTLIVEAQRLLGEAGFDAGPADGVLGAQTREAIRRFERMLGLPETGTVTPALVQELRAYAS